MKSVKCFVRRDAVVRSHKSDALLYRINHDESRILGSPVRKSFFLPDRLVQPEIRGIHTDGRRRSTYVSKIFFSYNSKKNIFIFTCCSILIFNVECCRARGIYYLSTNAHKPYARGLPVKNQRTTNRKRSSSHQYWAYWSN